MIDGTLFVCGGCSDPGGRVSEASVEVWDPRRGTWSPGPTLSVRRSRLGSAVLGRSLYVVGGFDGQRATYHSSCEVYEKRRGGWRRCGEMGAARATMARVLRRSPAPGQQPAGSCCCVFLCALCTSRAPGLLQTLFFSPAAQGVATLNGCIYVVGGCDGTGAHLATAERCGDPY